MKTPTAIDGIPLYADGKVSFFGGPNDTGVKADEGLGLYQKVSQRPDLFLDKQPPKTTGLARRLNPAKRYLACRWNAERAGYPVVTRQHPALIVNPKNGKKVIAWPADWGPNKKTGRVADVSPQVMADLGLKTDDTVNVYWPAPPDYKIS